MSYFRNALFLMVMLALVSCQHRVVEQPISPVTDYIAQNEELKIVEQPPQLTTTNWQPIIKPLIDKLLKIKDIQDNNLLLISDVKNNSNHYVSTTEVNKLILNLLSEQNIFNIIDKATVNQSKLILGIPYDDASISRNKMIALANDVKANYILFTSINQVPDLQSESADVRLELLSVESGKVINQFTTEQPEKINQP
ncbi:hypothetical protein C7375_10250 [Frischella perrara]|uniref:Penicillin-binding protein activator LpoB n=1 Tax=Frischella perrara TaxID=1267021 RepID=A0A0A7RZP3_FRIPE|nr:hypothetical protein [Frischella perrara]AJA44703.1 protein of unknown function (DUF3897) [Frischella perrara]PWV64975.1 hypothetical protein C7375_10250 [Frischella perrara]